MTDGAGNTASATGEHHLDTTADLAPALTLTIDTANLVTNNAEKTAVGFTVSGLDGDLTAATVTFTDAANNTVVVNVVAGGHFRADLSLLNDGPITSVLAVTDDAGNTAQTNGANIDLDTTADLAPALTLDAGLRHGN